MPARTPRVREIDGRCAMSATTQASQLWCIEAYLTGIGWRRVSPVINSQADAEEAMPKYARQARSMAIRATPFVRILKGKKNV